jgi:hypothetical protein
MSDAPSFDPEFDDPLKVSDHVLEVTRDAYWNRDFPAFAERFFLPQTVGKFEGERCLETENDLRSLYDASCAYFESNGILDLKRRTTSALFQSKTCVQATFVSQHVLRGHVLSKETVVHGTLCRIGGLWRITESH